MSAAAEAPRWRLIAAALLQVVCYGVAWLCLATVVLFQFLFVLPGWTWNYEADALWERFRLVAARKYGMLDSEPQIIGGWDTMVFAFLWAPAAVASVVMLVPTLLLSKSTRHASWAAIASPPVDALKSVGRKLRRLAAHPMPFQRFWLSWCDGLTLFEAFLWSGWLICHLVGVWQLTLYYAKPLSGWDMMGITYSQPRNVYDMKNISLGFSWVLYLDFALLFFPVAHLSWVHTLLGSSWAACVKWHRWLGHFGMWALTGHAVFYYMYWLRSTDVYFWDEFFDWNTKSSINYLAGSIGWVAGLVLWLTSLAWFRRRFFRAFYIVHILGAIIFVVFGHIHYYWTWIYFFPGLVAWGLDVVFRAFQAQHLSAVAAVRLTPSGGLAQLDIPLDPLLARSIKAGQDVFLQFHAISRWAWHPFTIFKINAPLPGDQHVVPSMTVAVKKYGRWTKAFLTQLRDGSGMVPVRVVGPAGGLHAVGTNTPRVIMFVGGVGASPALAMLHRMMDDGLRVPTTVAFVVRDMEELSILDERILSEATRGEKAWLALKLFCTGDHLVGAPRRSSERTSTSTSDGGGDAAPVGKATKGTLLEDAHEATGAELGAAASARPMGDAPPMTSPLGWSSVGPAQPRLLNTWHLLAAVCVAWAGAFLGAIQAMSVSTEFWEAEQPYTNAWTLGLVYVVCITVQALGLPAVLVVFPVHLARYLRRTKDHLVAALPASPSATIGYGCVRALEVGASLQVAAGRPDVAAVLHEAMTGATGEEVPVVVAGPASMLHAVCMAVWAANTARPKGAPSLRIIRETFDL